MLFRLEFPRQYSRGCDVRKRDDASGLKARIDAGEDIALIDIRSDAEVAQGILPNAEHLAMHLIPLRMHDLPKDKARRIRSNLA